MHWDVGVESLACPVAVIADESKAAVVKFFAARRAQQLGGVLYGTDASLWSARWYDTVTLLQGELEHEEAVAHKAIHSHRQ